MGVSRAKVELARTVLAHPEGPVKEALKSGQISINRANQLTQEKRKLDSVGKPIFNRTNDLIDWTA